MFSFILLVMEEIYPQERQRMKIALETLLDHRSYVEYYECYN